MLTISTLTDAKGAARYYRDADAKIEGLNLPAPEWHGTAAAQLGLTDFNHRDFENLLNGVRGEKLTKARGERRAGYDLTFSVPKSVSVLATVGGDERIFEAVMKAVEDAMGEAERDAQVRVRKGGADFDRDSGNLAWADFMHVTGRPVKGKVDPQLHVHAIVANLTLDKEEGQWKALQNGKIHHSPAFYNAVFRNSLAGSLKSLGYDITPSKNGFEVSGVPERTLKEFSSRTGLIEKVASALGIVRPEAKGKLGATTREKKPALSQWADLTDGWQARCRSDDLRAIRETVEQAFPREFETRDAEVASRVQRRHPGMSDRDRLTKALTRNVGEVTLEGLKREAKPHRSLRERLSRHLSFVGMNRERSFERERSEPTLGIG